MRIFRIVEAMMESRKMLKRIAPTLGDTSVATRRPAGVVLAVQTGTGEADQLVTMPLGGLPSSVALPIHVTSMSAGASSASVVIVGTDEAGKAQVLLRSGALWQNAPVSLTSARYAG